MALTRPTTTPLPDEIYDVWAPQLGEAEIKVLLYIVRRTLGFRKAADAISFTQFLHGVVSHEGRVLDHGCGVKSRRSLVAALKSLETKGLIRTIKSHAAAGDHDTTVYALWWEDDEVGGSSRRIRPGSPEIPRWYPHGTEVVARGHHGSSPRIPTTNSIPTNSQHNSETTRAGARDSSIDRNAQMTAVGELETEHDGTAALWQAVLADLQVSMTADNYRRWFAPTTARALDGTDLEVLVPSDAHSQWLDRRLRPRIDDALRRIGHPDVRVRFTVAS